MIFISNNARSHEKKIIEISLFNIRITRIKHISLHLPDCVNSSENWRIRAWFACHDACCVGNTEYKQKDSFLPQNYFTSWDQNIYSSLKFEDWVKLKLRNLNVIVRMDAPSYFITLSYLHHFPRYHIPEDCILCFKECNLKGWNWGFGSHTKCLVLFTHCLHSHSCWQERSVSFTSQGVLCEV
jgi:hypothetical protein